MLRDASEYRCPVEATIDVLGGRHKAIILWHLRDGKLRFSELSRRIQRVTPKMLTQQLRELEADNLITRTVYPVVPPKTEYALTEFGESLEPVLDAMRNWGQIYLNQVGTRVETAESSTGVCQGARDGSLKGAR